MAKAFYIKLAGTNLLRNKRMYGPYCVATALMSGMFFIILNLIFSKSVSNLSYGATVQAMFTVGIVVMTLFTVGYMLYINSFLIKRRKKEFGLYGVLGMERRHVARVILWESVILSVGALLLGLVGGAIFGRLAFMLLMNMLDTAQGSVFVIDGWAILVTLAIFLAIFFLATLYNLNQVRLASPADLLKGTQPGEKKVRFALPATLVGFALLGVAYYMAISVRNPAVALMQFWPAVILVIIATWLLFTGGSVFILRRLQKNRRIYYKPRNFIAISGLIHRMKQNAAGLANICILSSMVMVTVSCCCALYLGQDLVLRQQNPSDIQYQLRLDDKAEQARVIEETVTLAEALAAQQGIAIEQVLPYRFRRENVLYQDGRLTYRDASGALPDDTSVSLDDYYAINVILLEDFNAVTGRSETLAGDEVLLLTSNVDIHLTELFAEGGALSVRGIYHDTAFTQGKNNPVQSTLFAVVRDEDVAVRLIRALYPADPNTELSATLRIDIDADQEAGYAFAVALREAFIGLSQASIKASGSSGNYFTESIYTNRVDGYSLYGGLLFLGVFFAFLFLVNTVLIIYFKQISEGFDDCERFEILQKVGLSDEEVKSTINRQMLIVFLLPLVVALIHIAAASNMILQMLGTFMMTDFALTMTCILVTSLVFAIVYLCVYRLTARTYYRLVKW